MGDDGFGPGVVEQLNASGILPENVGAVITSYSIHYTKLYELLDQLVRTESGGEMERYLRSHVRGNTEYIISRIGCGANEYIKRTESQTSGHLIGEDDGQAESLRQAMWSFVVRLSRLFRASYNFV